jgi:hypothetical protein
MTNLQPQGGHYLVSVIPMTAAVIEAVECLAKADGMTNGIKFNDSTSIAGVDHNKTDADQFNDVFRDPDYKQKEKCDIALVVDD